MPLTLEETVDYFKEQRARQAQGRTRWDRSLAFGVLLFQTPANEVADPSHPDHVRKVATDIVELMKKEFPELLDISSKKWDRALEEVVDRLEWIAETDDKSVYCGDLVENLDTALDELYDWADANRVFLDQAPPSEATPPGLR